MQLPRCLQLVCGAASQQSERIAFMNKKLLTVEKAQSSQNDRSWFGNAPSCSAIMEHSQIPQNVIVWGDIYVRAKTPCFLWSKGVELTRTSTEATSSRPWNFHGPGNTLATWNGRSSRVPLRSAGRKQLRTGAKSILQFSLRLQNDCHTILI